MLKGFAATTSLRKTLEGTYNPHVLSKVGDYAGLYRQSNGKILVSSTDGVGTKISLACDTGKHEGIGVDLVHHCVNDILVVGARPLFFLNYFAHTSDKAAQYQHLVLQGMARAAKEHDMPIISGETATMKGFYTEPDAAYDLAGTIIGEVDEKELITGKSVKAGDKLIGLPSNGLHTNGYTLLRDIFCGTTDNEFRNRPPSLEKMEAWQTILEEALVPHQSYYRIVMDDILRFHRPSVHAMAHVTGGGIETNLLRVTNGHSVNIDWSSWERPQIFKDIERFAGRVPVDEAVMRSTYNLGIGFVLVVDEDDAEPIVTNLRYVGHNPVLMGSVGGPTV